jgi:hypothetical protein
LVAGGPLGAQRVLGIGDDAFVVPRGVFRIGVSGSWTSFDEVYVSRPNGETSGDAAPFGARLSLDTLGAAQIPALAPVERGLRALTGDPALTLSVGQTRASADATTITTPVAAELGLAGRLSVGVMVPYVVTRTSVVLDANADGGPSANVGFNPALGSEEARAANAALAAQFAEASALLGGALTSCDADPAAVGCDVLIARRDEALALIEGAGQFAAGVAQIYGTGAGSSPAPLVPLASAPAQRAIEERVAAFRAAYASFGVGDVITAPGPVGAPVALGAAGVQSVLSEPLFGVRADSLRTVERAHVGDIEVAAKLKLLDSFGSDPAARLSPSGFNYRAAVTGVVRLGTGQPSLPDDLTDVGRGDGQNDLEVRSALDLLFGRRFWASVIGRYVYQQADEQVVRIAERPDVAIVPYFRRQLVERKLGNYYELEANPRFVFNDYLSVGGHYLYRQKGEDEYSGRFVVDSATTGVGAIDLDAGVLNAGTGQTEHRVGGGVAFSTVAAYNRGRARVPLELTYLHYTTARGTGGNLPKRSFDQIQLRVYTRIFGGPR